MGYRTGICERYLGGHLSWNLWGRHVVLYGFNAMHVALNVRMKSGNWFCFHPPMRCFGQWWQWYCYVSPDATPSAATFARGPGIVH